MLWGVANVRIRDQLQMPLAIALNRQQIIQADVHVDRVKIILVNLFLTFQPTLPCPRLGGG